MLIFYNFVRCGDCTMFLVTTKCLAETPELSEEIKGLSLIWNFYNLTYCFPKSYILGKVILLDKKCYIYGFLWGETLLFFSWLLDRLVLVSGEHKNPRTTQPISGFSALPPRSSTARVQDPWQDPKTESLLRGCIKPGGGGALNTVLYGEAPPRGPNPYLFIYHFW